MSSRIGFCFLSVTVILLCVINAQENAQFRVPRSLEECYRNQELLERDNRLPMTIQTLISLIRKIENVPGLNQNMKQISVSLLHRFRQDGIIRAPGVVASPSVLPYSPADFQFTKHKILLSRLIPGDALKFPNETLNAIERCTLHFMLSSSIDRQVRGDEGQRCSQLAQYRSMRVPREIDHRSVKKSNFLGDVEFLEKIQEKVQSKPSGKISVDEDMKHDEDVTQHPTDYEDVQAFGADIGLIDIANNPVSRCPVENGVIWTPWGAVNAGNLIAGIAAGLQPEKVQLRTLLALARRSGTSTPQMGDIFVDNKWAATLAGDLAEAALIQAPNSQVRIGASGVWNSTTEPRWYFLTQHEQLEMTDAEIRGGLDGLIIAMKIEDWKNNQPNMKLSQLLDMYYSQRGVLDSGIRACDRRLQFTNGTIADQLKSQAISFATVLERDMQLRVTLFPEGIKASAIKAVDALTVYVPKYLNDLSCEATAATPNDPTIWKTATDLLVYIDTTWQYHEISSILGWIWPNIDISPYESRVTLLNAADCKVIVSTTSYTTEISSKWNATSHRAHPAGLNLPNVLKSIQNSTQSLMATEKTESSSGGRSLIALVVAHNKVVNEADANAAKQLVDVLREQVPDLKILFMATGTVKRFAHYVREENKDLFTVKTGDDNVVAQANPVIKRIREIPRRIINPRCGANWQSGDSGQSQMTQLVTPGSVNYYRLHPNYFFKQGTGRRLRIQGKGGPALTVCSSRLVELPRDNATKVADLNCKQVISETFEVDLDNLCSDHSVIHQCPSLYISVEGKRQSGTTHSQCQEVECTAPDQISYVVQTENLGCFSGVRRFLGSVSIIIGFLSILQLTR